VKVVFGSVFINLIYGAPETAMQLDNGPVATCLCDIQDQQNRRMDSGYKSILFFSCSIQVEPKMFLNVSAHAFIQMKILNQTKSTCCVFV